MPSETQRPVSLPVTVASLIESWMADKRTGYMQLNFAQGTIPNVTVHTTIPVQGVRTG